MRTASAMPSAKSPSPEPSTSAISGRSAVFERTNSATAPARENSSRGTDWVATVTRGSRQQYSHNRSRHQVCHGSGEHGAEAQPGQFAALVLRQRADAADLYADGAEVGESAECEGGDGERARVEHR